MRAKHFPTIHDFDGDELQLPLDLARDIKASPGRFALELTR